MYFGTKVGISILEVRIFHFCEFYLDSYIIQWAISMNNAYASPGTAVTSFLACVDSCISQEPAYSFLFTIQDQI